MLLIHSNPDVTSVSLPTDVEDEYLAIDRRGDGTFDVPHDRAAELLEWPQSWSMAPPPLDPELAGDVDPDALPPLKDLRKAELQGLCLARGLDNSGTTPVLIDRLREWAAARQSA